MKILILLSIYSSIFNVNMINGRDFSDGQFACAFGKSLLKKSTPRGLADWIADSSVEKEDVKFFLYNKKINDEKLNPMEIFPDNKNDSLQNALRYGVFDITKLTKIIIHGYKSGRDKGAVRLIREGFFKNGDYNLLVVDWSGAQQKFGILWPYDAVIKKLDAVAQHVSRMLFSIENNGMDHLMHTTIVGHSLGAHVAGMASFKVRNKIGRIVALDPAGPLIGNLKHRLSKDNAIEVEVIHTEIENCGLEDQMGHYDFYINGGLRQPGCETYRCSHARSYEYFAEALDPKTKGFYARRCVDLSAAVRKGNCSGRWILMGGLHATSGEYGIYYVKTNNRSLFAQGLLYWNKQNK